MAFETYDAARRYALLIRTVTQEKAMPPAFAIPLAGRVANDPSLTAAQISTLAAWANLNAPAGDAKDAAAVPGAAPWNIPEPDLVIKMPEPASIPAAGNLDYVYEIVPPQLSSGRWIQMAEVLPSTRANVLQIVVFIRRPGSSWLRHAPVGKPFTSATLTVAQDHHFSGDDILAVYAPGSSPRQLPPSLGMLIPAGADLVFRAQYITNGAARLDQGSVGLVFSKQKPSRRVVTLLLENERFSIPPNAPEYRVEARGVLRTDVVLLSVFPLLHLRGKSFEFDVMPPRGRTNHHLAPQIETLLRVNYDQRWQPSYLLAEPRSLKTGMELRAIAWYDNSPTNPHNPNPDVSVHWGDQSQDEALQGFFDVAIPANRDPRDILIQR